MKKFLKIIFVLTGIILLLLIAVLAYLNFIYLPPKVASEGPAFLKQKSNGQIQAETIEYVPFKGARLKNVVIVSKNEQPITTIDQLYLNVDLWTLIIRRDLHFDLNIYPKGAETPVRLSGLYRVQEKSAAVNLTSKTDLFAQPQTITGTLSAQPDQQHRLVIKLELNSPDLNLEGDFYTQNQDLRIEKFSGKVLDSPFNFIGDVQDLTRPSLNIYGDLELNLAGLKNLNPKYIEPINKYKMQGRCPSKIYISGEMNSPEVGLKVEAREVEIANVTVDSLTISAKLQNQLLSLNKCYLILYGGEINLEGDCDLGFAGLPTNLIFNIFNMELNNLIADITEKSTPVHGRLFSLGKLKAPLKDYKQVEGKLWASASGSNILQLPLFAGIADILQLPQLRNSEFKEASGNFSIAQQAISTEDFKIISNSVVIYFKGYMDFAGDLGFDIRPSFSESFLHGTPRISNILGVFFDSTGNFLGEIKMKGSLQKPRLTYKPVAADKLFPRVLEEGLKHLFKSKDEE